MIHPQDMVEESKLGFKGGGEVLPKAEPDAFIDNAQKKGDFYCDLCDVKMTNKSQKKRHIATAEHKQKRLDYENSKLAKDKRGLDTAQEEKKTQNSEQPLQIEQ